MEQACKMAIEGLEKSISAIEKLIKELIKSEDILQNNYDLWTPILGIGKVTAVYLIVCANNFAGNISGR